MLDAAHFVVLSCLLDRSREDRSISSPLDTCYWLLLDGVLLLNAVTVSQCSVPRRSLSQSINGAH